MKTFDVQKPCQCFFFSEPVSLIKMHFSTVQWQLKIVKVVYCCFNCNLLCIYNNSMCPSFWQSPPPRPKVSTPTLSMYSWNLYKPQGLMGIVLWTWLSWNHFCSFPAQEHLSVACFCSWLFISYSSALRDMKMNLQGQNRCHSWEIC